jgi:hypothetical protein
MIESDDLKDLGYVTLFRDLFVYIRRLQIALVKSTAAVATALRAVDPDFETRFQGAMLSADKMNMPADPELEQTLATLEQVLAGN